MEEEMENNQIAFVRGATPNTEEHSDSTELATKVKPSFVLYKIRLRNWWRLIGFFLVLETVLLIGTLATPRWVEQGSDPPDWRGGLLRCGECKGQWHEKYYSEIVEDCNAEEETYIQSDEGFCKDFKKIYEAGIIFLVLELVALVLLLFWTVRVVYAVWITEWRFDWWLYIVSGAAFILHLAATITWMLMTEAKPEECDKVSTSNDTKDICFNFGMRLAFSQVGLLSIILPVFNLIWLKKHKAIKK